MNPQQPARAAAAEPTAAASRLAPLKAWWSALARRERLLVAGGSAALALYVVFAVAVQPAWRTIRAAPAQLDSLDTELQAMQTLALETRDLRATPPVDAAQSAAALKAASDRLGDKAKLSLQGERAVLTVTGVGTEQLRGWLAEARSGARARPLEANLSRSAGGYSGSIIVAIGGTP